MKKYYILLLLLFRSGIVEVYAQDTPLKHRVSKGETIEVIAKKYQVSTTEIYELNPSLSEGFKENDIILIPKTKIWNTKETDTDPIYHLVQPRETKFGISKKYNISIEELERQNPHIVAMLQAGHELRIQPKTPKNNQDTKKSIASAGQNGAYTSYLVERGETLWGIARRYKITVSELIDINRDLLGAVLQTGQTLRVPVKGSQQMRLSDSGFEQHLVEAGETKYGLSRKYGVSIAELENLNPQIVKMLRTGQQISIPGRVVNKPIEKQTVQEQEPKPVATQPKEEKEIKPQPKVNVDKKDMVSYEVQAKETLYGLSKMTGLSEQELVELNPELTNGLKTGMVLKLPSENASAIATAKAARVDHSQSGLWKTLKKGEAKEIAFLMPFTEEKFLDFIKASIRANENVAQLEFYAGATMAMDSLKKSDVLITSKIVEIQSSARDEEGFSNLKTDAIQNYKAVFIPTEAYLSEKMGNYLSQNNIPIIISDTKKTKSAFATSYSSLVSDFQLKKLVLDYIVSKKQNLIIVNDPARKESKDFIAQNYPDAKFVKIDEDGVFDSESLKSLLSASSKNYVVLDTDKAGLILTATTLLLKDSKQYDVEIALLEPKESIQGEGLSEMRFKALKMIYPSLYKPAETKGLAKFRKDFVLKYGFEPTNEAIKGFDVTFDALVRLYQDRDFGVLSQEYATEQLRLSFKYSKNLDGGYSNSGGYILQYNEDSDAKIIN